MVLFFGWSRRTPLTVPRCSGRVCHVLVAHCAAFRSVCEARLSMNYSASRFISKTCQIAKSVTLLPGCVVLEGAVLGAHSVIGAGAVIGCGVRIGEGVKVGDGATLHVCRVGSSTIIHPGGRIGQDGFGFVLNEDASNGPHAKKPQTLGVVIGSDVEIGANTCVDRGSWRDTVIGDGVKIDNLVQIGHNVIVGDHSVIAAACGIGGSVTIGKRVLIGAMSGILQHVEIGDRAKIAARSGISCNIPPGSTYGGDPAVPIRQFHKQTIFLRKSIRRNV